MTRQFHPFPRLPTEIRLQIWELVLRSESDVPGAHFVSVQHNVSCNEKRFPDGTVTRGRFHPLAVVPTTSSEVARSLNLQHDPSSWRTDAGLWAANRESRAVIQTQSARRLAAQRTKPHAMAPLIRTDRDGRNIEVSVHFPVRDLFCFQVPALSKIDAVRTMTYLCHRGWYDAADSPGSEVRHQMAFEIDGDWPWTRGSRADEPGAATSFVRDLCLALRAALIHFLQGGPNIDVYLIDCKARLRPGAEVQGVFCASGVRLLKVDRDQVVYEENDARNWLFLEKIEASIESLRKSDVPTLYPELLTNGNDADAAPVLPIKLLIPERM
ncbi:hypothetical protein CkaCkLH20_11820 [Colletotrichum karsti]|uniref:2EXR domain-containing protein n=1 Tax=Colletotrichum karsti TaxID=1095194 RepID=A0A9P6LES1_9PEZI|nr:uncharacterized protein CkaCkLH20_11820 [Colletotrichum karsti]KAF9870718.1 hypothetical protein CkaCkLH20_11820 [Colletotrichum karsti]